MKHNRYIYTPINIQFQVRSIHYCDKMLYGSYYYYVPYGRYCLQLLKSIHLQLISVGIFQGKRKQFVCNLKYTCCILTLQIEVTSECQYFIFSYFYNPLTLPQGLVLISVLHINFQLVGYDSMSVSHAKAVTQVKLGMRFIILMSNKS